MIIPQKPIPKIIVFYIERIKLKVLYGARWLIYFLMGRYEETLL